MERLEYSWDSDQGLVRKKAIHAKVTSLEAGCESTRRWGSFASARKEQH